MKITYARLYNLGNYENERFEVEDVQADYESVEECASRLRRTVEALKRDADDERSRQRQAAQAPSNAF